MRFCEINNYFEYICSLRDVSYINVIGILFALLTAYAVFRMIIRAKAGHLLAERNAEIKQLRASNIHFSSGCKDRDATIEKLHAEISHIWKNRADIARGAKKSSPVWKVMFCMLMCTDACVGYLHYTEYFTPPSVPVNCDHVMRYVTSNSKMDRFTEVLNDGITSSNKKELSKLIRSINVMMHPDKIQKVFPVECHQNITEILMNANSKYNEIKQYF